VDILINNAGVSVAGPFEDVGLAAFRWLMETNFWGPVHGCRAFLPELRKRPGSCIVNVLSVFGLFGMPTKSAYCSAKFALRGFSECLRAELRGSGVGVIEAYPPTVDTRIIGAGRAWDPQKQRAEAEDGAKADAPSPSRGDGRRGVDHHTHRALRT